jgi:hypothetical protein
MTMTTQTLGSSSDGRGLAAALLDSEWSGVGPEAYRFFTGACLAAIYGLALGVRFGLGAMASHAVGVPMTLAGVALLTVPALYIGWAHFGVDLDPRVFVRATARGTATAGLVLAGLAPALLLLAVTFESSSSVAFFGAVGLAAGFALGMRAFFAEIKRVAFLGLGAGLLALGFVLFAWVLAGRMAWLALPLFRTA